MHESGEIDIDSFDYELPDSHIAQKAAEPRDSSKLLLYNESGISDHIFREIDTLIPEGSSLFFNNAKVIPARIHAKNKNNAGIEIFLLKPCNADYFGALNSTETSEWECLIGNSKKWRPEEKLYLEKEKFELFAERIGTDRVRLYWNTGQSFATVLDWIGKMPLPPYIRHEADEADKERYQTVYASKSGSVAAPTAGLHFTERVLERLNKKGIRNHFATLHVSAGTFLPVKVKNALMHTMHTEVFTADEGFIRALAEKDKRIAVGTTACRIMESLFWAAVNILEGSEKPFQIEQFVYRERKVIPDAGNAMKTLLEYMKQENLSEINGSTSIMIVPGYRFEMVDGLLTNFHQPKSTLLLLISAMLGEDWRKVYQHAIGAGYRFLSYGDSSLLLPQKNF